MCCTVGWPGPALAPVAGRRTVLELDITAAAAAPTGEKNTLMGYKALLKMRSIGTAVLGRSNHFIEGGILF